MALVGDNLAGHVNTVNGGSATIYPTRFIPVTLCFYGPIDQIRREKLMKTNDSWIIVTNTSKDVLGSESPAATAATLVEFTSWANGVSNGTARAAILLDFIARVLGRIPSELNRSDISCDRTAKERMPEKQKEIERVADSVRVDCKPSQSGADELN